MSHASFQDDGNVAVIRDWLRERVDDGVKCPCCMQFAKVYRRKIHAAMAHDLIRFYRAGAAGEWRHVRGTLGHDGGDFAKLIYWELIVEDDREREDGGRAGWWQITPKGVAYVTDCLRVPKYARIYDGRCLELIGAPVGIRDALGMKFSYRQLMDGL